MELKYKKTGRGSKTVLFKKTGNESYLSKIIEDAVKAENPRCGIESAIKRCTFNEWELEDGSHWISIDGTFSDYERIYRRVSFRLNNNKWIERKTVLLWEEGYDIPGRFCREYRYWYS